MAAADRDFHKQAKHLRPIATAPFYAIDLRMVGNPYWPTPMMSLGGLKVQRHPLCAIESDLHAICTPPHANYVVYLRAAVGLPIFRLMVAVERCLTPPLQRRPSMASSLQAGARRPSAPTFTYQVRRCHIAGRNAAAVQPCHAGGSPCTTAVDTEDRRSSSLLVCAGLSLAECIFSGRRAGHHAAT